ncbi:MAG: hypothetical protein B7Z37_31075 [Verrucomicrobia bacterium 12-59-8]|nr:MAG: hypothetical protein B7Z37_31075 [Verrucomicrobia bacterium 12-59-8]
MSTPHSPRPNRPSSAYHDLPALKERLLIPEVWRRLGLEGEPAERCRSPFRPDKNPSFSIYKGGRQWKDHATGQSGDVIDFIALARQLSKGDAVRLFLELAGVPPRSGTCQVPRPKPTPSPSTSAQASAPRRTTFKEQATALLPPQEEPHPDGIRVPLQSGTEADRQLVADSRHLTVEAVSLALSLRTFTFAIVQGYRCWLLTDAENRVAEARRLDGLPFPECGTLGRRKAHTLRGSRKSWPLGAAVLRRVPEFRTLLLVEGGPDYLAALHFAHELERWDVLPVAMLGRGTGTKIDPAALELMRGRRVRIYPHADADGGGVQSARRWAAQLHKVACEVDIYELTELRRTDGKPVKDLNDCTAGLDEASAAELREGLFPKPDREVEPPFGDAPSPSLLSATPSAK